MKIKWYEYLIWIFCNPVSLLWEVILFFKNFAPRDMGKYDVAIVGTATIIVAALIILFAISIAMRAEK